jgi:putative intracellular protease/amidase
MAVGDVPLVDEAAAIIKEANSAGKPVAAQQSSVLTLAKAGVLSGKKYAYSTEEAAGEKPELKNGVYSGNGIVKDGNIITSGICPYLEKRYGEEYELVDGTPQLTQAFITALGTDK